MSEPLSLDAPIRFWSRSGGDDGPELHEYLQVEAPERFPDVTALREGLVDLLDGLAPLDQLVLVAWFGLADGRARTLTEIAEILALTGNSISYRNVYAVLQGALAKMRAPNFAAALAALTGEHHDHCAHPRCR